MGQYTILEALGRNFAVSFVVVSPNDTQFHKFDDVYHKIVSGLRTPMALSGDEYVKVASESISWAAFTDAQEKMSQPGYWESRELLKAITAMMPDYRLSKFQAYLPGGLQLKLVADTILDLPGGRRFLDGK